MRAAKDRLAKLAQNPMTWEDEESRRLRIIREALQKFDEDGSGEIDGEEMRAAMI